MTGHRGQQGSTPSLHPRACTRVASATDGGATEPTAGKGGEVERVPGVGEAGAERRQPVAAADVIGGFDQSDQTHRDPPWSG